MTPNEMTPGRDGHHQSADVAAYALGALEPTEAEAFRLHLQTCAVCLEELRAFQRTVDDLAIGVPQHEAPADLRGRVLRAVEQEPHRASAEPASLPGRTRPRRERRDAVVRGRSWLRAPTLALVSGMAFALAAIIVVVVAFPGRQNGRTVRAATSIGGTAALHISANRTELVLRHVAAPPPGKIYEVWLQHGKGQPQPNARFGLDRQGDASVAVAGSMYGVSRVMVTAEPAPHGTRHPTGQAVVSASLS